MAGMFGKVGRARGNTGTGRLIVGNAMSTAKPGKANEGRGGRDGNASGSEKTGSAIVGSEMSTEKPGSAKAGSVGRVGSESGSEGTGSDGMGIANSHMGHFAMKTLRELTPA